MVQQNQHKSNSTPDTGKAAAAGAIQKVLAGVRIGTHQDYGEYREIVEAVMGAFDQGGVKAAQRSFMVLKRANPKLADLDVEENLYPLDLHLNEDDLHNLDKYPYTDLGQGESIAHLYCNRLRFAVGMGWLVWTGLRWKRDERRAHLQIAGVVSRARQQAVLARPIAEGDKVNQAIKFADIKSAIRSENLSRLEAAISVASTHPSIVHDVNEFDKDPYLLGVKNGIVDLRTGELTEPDPDLLMTKRNEINYIPDAPCPRWLKFLNEVFDGNKGLLDYFHRVVGYSLTGLRREHAFWLFYGTGRNGKGTIFRIMEQLGGDYATNTGFSTFEARRENSAAPSEDLASLRGSRVVLISEANEGAKINEERIKKVTGEDTIPARFMYQSRFEYKAQFKLFMAVNHKPTISGTDPGIWSRVKLIPFNVSFMGREDLSLQDKLNLELPGILAWAVRGAIEYQKRGLAVDESVAAATEAYRDEQDILGQWFKDSVQSKVGSYCSCKALHENYKAWADEMGLNAWSQPRLGKALAEKGFSKVKKTDGWYWENLAIIE
jgi:putative DNA primase/helicase